MSAVCGQQARTPPPRLNQQTKKTPKPQHRNFQAHRVKSLQKGAQSISKRHLKQLEKQVLQTLFLKMFFSHPKKSPPESNYTTKSAVCQQKRTVQTHRPYFLLGLCLTVAAENIYNLSLNHFLDSFSCGRKILSGIKMIGMLVEILSY